MYWNPLIQHNLLYLIYPCTKNQYIYIIKNATEIYCERTDHEIDLLDETKAQKYIEGLKIKITN